jgi:hypothetical protein
MSRYVPLPGRTQVTLTNSGCTDYFDARACIVRGEEERLEKKIGALTRKLGMARSKQAMASFLTADRERLEQTFMARLQSLPLKDGVPDFTVLGDPVRISQQWTTEMGMGRKELLGRILGHLASWMQAR